LASLNLPKIFKDTSALLNPITKYEILASLKSLASGSAPSRNGVTRELLLCYWQQIKKFVCNLIIDMFKGNIPPQIKEGLITLLPKKQGICAPNEFRPICINNTIYKIYMKILATRIEPFLEEITFQHQYAVKSKTMDTAIRLAHEITVFANIMNIPFFKVIHDQEKAFDRASHNYIIEDLRCRGIPEKFIQWIFQMYRDTYVRIKFAEGEYSSKIQYERGAKQGDPMSAIIYCRAIDAFLVEMERRL